MAPARSLPARFLSVEGLIGWQTLDQSNSTRAKKLTSVNGAMYLPLGHVSQHSPSRLRRSTHGGMAHITAMHTMSPCGSCAEHWHFRHGSLVGTSAPNGYDALPTRHPRATHRWQHDPFTASHLMQPRWYSGPGHRVLKQSALGPPVRGQTQCVHTSGLNASPGRYVFPSWAQSAGTSAAVSLQSRASAPNKRWWNKTHFLDCIICYDDLRSFSKTRKVAQKFVSLLFAFVYNMCGYSRLIFAYTLSKDWINTNIRPRYP